MLEALLDEPEGVTVIVTSTPPESVVMVLCAGAEVEGVDAGGALVAEVEVVEVVSEVVEVVVEVDVVDVEVVEVEVVEVEVVEVSAVVAVVAVLAGAVLVAVLVLVSAFVLSGVIGKIWRTTTTGGVSTGRAGALS